MDRGASRILLMVAKIVGDQAKPPARAAGDVHPISSSRSISPQSRGLVAAPAARRHNKKVVARCGRPFRSGLAQAGHAVHRYALVIPAWERLSLRGI